MFTLEAESVCYTVDWYLKGSKRSDDWWPNIQFYLPRFTVAQIYDSAPLKILKNDAAITMNELVEK